MTTTTLAPGSITEVIEAHEFEPECAARCGRPAQLCCIVRLCGCSSLLCIPCRDKAKARYNFNEPGLCRKCYRSLGIQPTWEAMIREVPL